MIVWHSAAAARLVHLLKHLDVMVLYVEHHVKLPLCVQVRNSNTGKYIFNILWIWLGRQPSCKQSQEKCKIEKTLLVNSFFFMQIGKRCHY
jgi:hypothetical protein